MTVSDSKLRHFLGTIFPLFSSMSQQHQLAMEAAFIPTMNVLFDARVTYPLAEIYIKDVNMFLVHPTREDMQQSYDPNILESSMTISHNSFATAVCKEILSSPDSFQTKVLIKIFTSLPLTDSLIIYGDQDHEQQADSPISDDKIHDEPWKHPK
jgi:hypothetical protein